MFDFLNKAYAIFFGKLFVIKNKKSPIRIIANILSKILRFIILKNLWLMRFPKEPLVAGSGIVVSMTSFPKRFPMLKYTIASILRQTIRPEKIIVNLTLSECPNGIEDLPMDLIEFQKFGVVFVFRELNLKPHGKYFYVFQEYMGKLVVTVDDDILYRRDAISNLFQIHKEHPNAVCARLARNISFHGEKIDPYKDWSLSVSECSGNNILALGFGGVLYPTNLFLSSGLFDVENIRKLCLNADDLWLKANELLLGIPVASGKFCSPDVALESSLFDGLSSKNVNESANDIQWKALDKAFGLNKKILS